MVRLVKHWKRLPRKLVESQFLERFKLKWSQNSEQPAAADHALSRGIDLENLQSPFLCYPSCESVHL